MDKRTLLRYETELESICATVKYGEIFTAGEVSIHGNVLRKMWQEDVLIRVGKRGESFTYKLPSLLKSQIEVIVNGEENKLGITSDE